MVTMLIDHLTAVFVQNGTVLYLVGRGIGRIAFPIFCFLIVEGYFHTRNVWKYMSRLGILALVSEIPFDLAFYRQLYYPEYQNVAFTLLMGLVTITLTDEIKKRFYPFNIALYTILTSVVLITFGLGAQLLNTDYGMFGVLVIVFMFYLRGRRALLFACYVIGTLLCFRIVGFFELVSAVAFVFILNYNGQKGPDDRKLFYLFYPGHLAIIAVVLGIMYGWQIFA